jgi:hypothetical protein
MADSSISFCPKHGAIVERPMHSPNELPFEKVVKAKSQNLPSSDSGE